MKKYSLLLSVIFISTMSCMAQSDTVAEKKNNFYKTEGTVYTIVEQMPEFPGGEKKMLDYVSDNFKVPKGTPDGRVYVNFVITTAGKVTNARIIKGANAA